jgi:hypothetical protein
MKNAYNNLHQFRLANLDLEPGQEIVPQEKTGEEETKASDQTEDDDDDGPDVIVETPTGNDVTSTPGRTTTSAAKKNRRGRRGTKKSAKKETVGSPPVVDSPQPVPSCPAVTPRRPPKVPLVEYAVESVLRHREAASFVKRTGRVVNILEFKHTRVAAGIPEFFQVNILIFADPDPVPTDP